MIARSLLICLCACFITLSTSQLYAQQKQPSTKPPIRGVIQRASVTTDLRPVDRDTAMPSLSGDGRYLVFSSASEELVTDDDNRVDDIFLYNRQTRTTTLISQGINNTQSNGWSDSPIISADGQVIAFYSWSSTLVEGDTNSVRDAFVYDASTDEITRVSLSSSSEGRRQANDRSGGSQGDERPALSADGQFVAFRSFAANLVENDVNGRADIFVHDRETGETTLVSRASSGKQSDHHVSHPSISADGRLVAFHSAATTLVDTPHDDVTQVFLHDGQTGETTLVSYNELDDLAANGDATAPALSANGRFIAFQSTATNLTAQDRSRVSDIFLYDHTTNAIELVSLSSSGTPANRDAHSPTISADGRYIAFVSAASNLVDNDTNSVEDVFVHDRTTRRTWRVSVTNSGRQPLRPAHSPMLATNVPIVTFVSADASLIQDSPAPRSQRTAANTFIYSWQEPTTHTLNGRIVDVNRNPLADVNVSVGPHTATTNAQGRYAIDSLVADTYTVLPYKAGYDFLNAPRRVDLAKMSTSSDQQAKVDFIGFFDGGEPDPFLDIPFAYDDTLRTFFRVLRDADDGGLITAWFDHAFPNYSTNDGVLLWDGRTRSSARYHNQFGCYERRCYDGHSGTDFYPATATPLTKEPFKVRAAAPGAVVSVIDYCAQGDWRCGDFYGNSVVIDHRNGYFTFYTHLASVAVSQSSSNNPTLVERGELLGIMGNTGYSFGTHLHFAVHRDNGNGRWDGDDFDLAVDPFGWSGVQPDPWPNEGGGPASHWLWLYEPRLQVDVNGATGANVESVAGDVTLSFPANAFEGRIKLAIVPGVTGQESEDGNDRNNLQSIGNGFTAQILAQVGRRQTGQTEDDSDVDDDVTEQFEADRPIRVQVQYDAERTQHLDLDQLTFYRWDTIFARWSPLPTVVDKADRLVYSGTYQLGQFDLRAPLLCPADITEPDDGYHSAGLLIADTIATNSGTPRRNNVTQLGGFRFFDSSTDEDWVQFDALEGQDYVLTVAGGTRSVRPVAWLYDTDGLTILEKMSNGETQTWQPEKNGTYFVRVAQERRSSFGCDAWYTVVILVSR
ncbi:MAG: peptidoglycan DD-metalloendopeptidase family protein [Chloroflexota bacterium]